jgi:hypothetical protein
MRRNISENICPAAYSALIGNISFLTAGKKIYLTSSQAILALSFSLGAGSFDKTFHSSHCQKRDKTERTL